MPFALSFVIPTEAGIQLHGSEGGEVSWIPAFAAMTEGWS